MNRENLKQYDLAAVRKEMTKIYDSVLN